MDPVGGQTLNQPPAEETGTAEHRDRGHRDPFGKGSAENQG
jgi:hypothetical protein